jgi:hypothetical protein
LRDDSSGSAGLHCLFYIRDIQAISSQGVTVNTDGEIWHAGGELYLGIRCPTHTGDSPENLL